MIKIKSINIEKGELEQVFSILPSSEPDPDWVFVDSAGNEHRWEKLRSGAWRVPTLKFVEGEPPRCECCDQITGEPDAWWEAPTGERVELGMRPYTGPEKVHTLPGLPPEVYFEVEADELSELVDITTNESKLIDLSLCIVEGSIDQKLTGRAAAIKWADLDGVVTATLLARGAVESEEKTDVQ